MKFNDNEFKKSSLCHGQCQHCVAVAHKEDTIAVRNTRDEGRTTVTFSKAEWQLFITGVKNGEFDF